MSKLFKDVQLQSNAGKWKALPDPKTYPSVRDPDYEDTRKSLNNEYQRWWSSLLLYLKPFAIAELKESIKAEIEKISEIKLLRLWEPEINIQQPVGYEVYEPYRIKVRAPLKGSYSIRIKAKLHIKKRLPLGLDIKTDEVFTFVVRKLHVAQEARFRHLDPENIEIIHLSQPNISFKIDIEGDGLSSMLIAAIGELFVDYQLNNIIRMLTRKITEKFPTLIRESKTPLAPDAPLLSGPVKPIGFKRFINNLEKKISGYHLPYGTLMAVDTDREDNTTWIDHYSGSSSINAQNYSYLYTRDSPIFTGIYLASQSYRYAVTKNEQAIKNIRQVLAGIDRLFKVNDTGLMARLAVPADSPLARKIKLHGIKFRQRKLEDGKVWISIQDKGITRDQYLGILFGLATLYEHVAEDYKDIGSAVKRLLALQFNFMMRNNWFLVGDETRTGVPNFWTPGSDQKYAYLAVNNFVTGGKYQAQLNEIKRGVPAVWLTAWLNTCNTVARYYKFDLAYLSYYCVLHFETDPLIRKHIQGAHRIVESAIHNHLNPHFDLMRIDFGSVKKEHLADNIRAAMSQYIQRGHRKGPVDRSLMNKYHFRELHLDSGKETVTTIPVWPKDRSYVHFFQWERNPWSLACYPGNKKIESVGLSITWPYWFGRYLGVFSEDD
ncbi:hypothetical protein [Candidatus Thiosymbion oneisti]|uniref:hypothetical protein n=1 Tax=Candidatus Thiosymbion oneisti TaxID=589554 RepID=UPI00105DC216|nr:hypothetical protein [Candidatus Thiosymbion oneisti]